MNIVEGRLLDGASQSQERRRDPLGGTVRNALKLYFRNLDGHSPASIYQMVIAEVERPMFETVMEYVKCNQSRAAQVLGISRSTLRKKLKAYGLD